MPFIIPAHGHYPEWSVTIEGVAHIRAYASLWTWWLGHQGRPATIVNGSIPWAIYEYEWVTPDGVKHNFYTEVIKPRLDEIWDWYQVNKQIIKKLHKEQK